MKYYPQYKPTEKGMKILKTMIEETLHKSDSIRIKGFTTAELSNLVGFTVYGATMRSLIGHYVGDEHCDNKTYYTLLHSNTRNLLFFNLITEEEALLLENVEVSWTQVVGLE